MLARYGNSLSWARNEPQQLRTMAIFFRISKSLVGLLFIIAWGFFPNLALGGGQEFHISGIVYSIDTPRSIEVPGRISVIEDRTFRIRTVEFSAADEQRWDAISSIRPRDHVRIDGAIMGNEREFFSIIIDGSGGARGNPTAKP